MNIGIITQPLSANYGGILQAYALQTFLNSHGHNAYVLEKDRHIHQSVVKLIFKIPVRLLRKFLLKNKTPIFYEKDYNLALDNEGQALEPFISKYIKRKILRKYQNINQNEYDALIVGSDQVWRYSYYPQSIHELFLSFVPDNSPIKRIAYAASFGTENWEYPIDATEICKNLCSRFYAVSVREISGVNLCRKFLNVRATHVLDPTLLLDKNKYIAICQDIPECKNDYICAYILELSDSDRIKLSHIAKSLQLELKLFSAQNGHNTLSMEQWLASIRDAKMVITNSFHGTVFSIIFNKEFYCIKHPHKGNARIESLFGQLNIPNRLFPTIDAITLRLEPIDWVSINNTIKLRQHDSMAFLNTALLNKQL